MPVLTKALSALFVKVEATEGVDATPAAGDAVQLMEHAIIRWGAEVMNPQDDLENQLLDEGFPLPPAAKYMEVQAKAWIRGAGSAYNGTTIFPELHAVLQSLGLAAAFVTSHEDYDTASTATKSVTVYGFRETDTGVWVKYPLVGGRCNRAVVTFEAGKPVVIEFTIRGLFVQPSDGSFITPTYQTSVAPLFGAASSWALGALSPNVRRATITHELTLVPQLSGNAVDSLVGYKSTKRRISFDARFEGARIADYDAFTAWKNAPQNALAIAIGTGANNKFTITADKGTLFEPMTYEDDQGLWLHSISGRLTPEGTNRMKWSFTA